MAQYKRIPYQSVEHTEIARKSYQNYERNKDAPDETETEAAWIAKRKVLEQILNKLTYRQRQVYILKVGSGMAEKAIADKLGITQQAVSKIYKAACSNIQKSLVK